MLRFIDISKAFSGVQALEHVSFDVAQGSVHGLCGENGAGKSTLLKVLSGVHRPDSGNLENDGRAFVFNNTQDALDAGVAVIYQELNLVPELSVAENIWLGHLPATAAFVNRKVLHDRTTVSLKQVGLEVNPSTKVSALSLAQRQMVEIAKALTHDAKVIAFDEPTSSLSAREVETLFGLIDELKTRGFAIIYVSHRMAEITRLCDACTVLRDGKHIETFPQGSKIEVATIVNRMVGRELVSTKNEAGRAFGEPTLEVSNVQGVGLHEAISLKLRKGEIVGIFGLIGAGRTELLKAIYDGRIGDVRINGVNVSRGGASQSIRNGLVLCPEDRKKEGIVPMLSVAENLNISIRRSFAKLGVWIAKKKERENASEFIAKLRIKTASPELHISQLSGGNQQKVILGRWLSENVKVILLDEPTRGIDVGAKAEIYGFMRELAEKGIGVLFVSSELPEILALSDRVIVMCDGRITGELVTSEATEQELLSLALPKSTMEVPA